jgi:UDP-glucose:(heptosyl)LPS alpha-1,3-glucosyltransferase
VNIAFCYESVLPARGGCETYIADLARRLASDGHQVHLYACRWDDAALPPSLIPHALTVASGPRFLRPWRFGAACERALADTRHDVTVGFDKTWSQDVLYPQGGLHAASAAHNIGKHRRPLVRLAARFLKAVDPAHWSFLMLERKQYLSRPRPLIVVNSHMVQRHFQEFYAVPAADLRVVRSAIDPGRFVQADRLRRRLECRQEWNLEPGQTVALFVAMNYRLKGLDPLLRSLPRMKHADAFRLVVIGNPRTKPYERLARRLGVADRVRFLGPRRDVENGYFAADFLVHPTFYDPCSLVVLEALACGLPVITSRFNGAAELLHPPHDGQVIDNPHNHGELAAMLDRWTDPARRLACAQAARRTAQGWTFEQHYQQMLGVFREAAARRRAA